MAEMILTIAVVGLVCGVFLVLGYFFGNSRGYKEGYDAARNLTDYAPRWEKNDGVE